jgi:hypothetical protein
MLGTVAHVCNPVWEAEAEGSQVQTQSRQLNDTLSQNKIFKKDKGCH